MTTVTILLVILAVVVAFSISYFQYFFKVKKRSIETRFLAILRFLTVLTVLILLINPKINSVKLTAEKPILNIAVDNSSSIKFAKATVEVSDGLDKLRQHAGLNDKFNLQYYAFADELRPLDSVSFSISQTNISKAIHGLNEINRDRIAPIVLLTDGNQTHGSDYRYYVSKQPVYTVVVGDTTRYEDLKISQLNANAYASLNNKFPVEVFLNYDGDATVNKQFTIRQGNQTVFSKMLTFSPQDNAQQVQVNLPASSIGLKHYIAQIAPVDNEKNSINNVKNFSVEVIDEQAKILLLTEMKHPDIGMLKRAIETNELVQVIIEEDLTKNLNVKDYQLVIFYQPTAAFKKAFSAIEEAKANMFFITGLRTDWNFLNENQPYFSKNSLSSTEQYGGEFNADYDEFIVEDIGFSSFAPLRAPFGQINMKSPYKTLLFQNIENFSTDSPLLSTFTMEQRRGAVLFGEGIWKWRMLTEIEQQSPVIFDTFLHKIIQYLSSTKRARRLEIDFDPLVYSNGILKFNAQYYDANYVFDPSAKLAITITNQDTQEKQTIPLALKNNTFEISLSDLAPGPYNFNVVVENQNIQKSGYFSVLAYDIEQQLSIADAKGLSQLALASNAQAYATGQLDVLINDLLENDEYRTIQRSTATIRSLIDLAWLMGLLILLLAVEWLVRKYRGLV